MPSLADVGATVRSGLVSVEGLDSRLAEIDPELPAE